MPERPKLICECRHLLAERVRLDCPSAPEDSESLRGLVAIVERILAAALGRQTPSDPTPVDGRGGPA